MPRLLLRNFEDGTAQGVTASSGGVLAASTVAVITSSPYSGSFALRHTSNGSGTIEFTSPRVAVAPGSSITCSVQLRPGPVGRTHTLGVAYYDSGGTFLSTQTSGYSGFTQNAWSQVTVFLSAEVPVNAATVAFIASVANTASGNYYDIDDVIIDTVDYFSTDPLYESFNKADGTTLGPNLTWNNNLTISNRTALGFSVTNGKITHTPSSSTSVARVENAVGNDQACSFDLHAINNDIGMGVGPMLRVDTTTGPTTYYVFRVQGNGTYSVWKRVSNSLTDFVADAAIPGGLGTLPGRARFEVQGSTLRCYWRGAEIYSRTDTSITTGRLGLWGSNGASTIRLDDFSGGTLTKTITVNGQIDPVGRSVKLLPRTVAGSSTMAGAITTIRAVLKILTGSVTPAGSYIRTFNGIIVSAISATGALVKTAPKTFAGWVWSGGFLMRASVRTFLSSVATTGSLAQTFLGRVIGRAGSAIMSLRGAGEARMRFRRR